jgi:hypothetical protein
MEKSGPHCVPNRKIPAIPSFNLNNLITFVCKLSFSKNCELRGERN